MSRCLPARPPRVGWLAGAVVATSLAATSLVAACGTAGPSQPANTPTPAASESRAGTQPPATSPCSDSAPASPAPAVREGDEAVPVNGSLAAWVQRVENFLWLS